MTDQASAPEKYPRKHGRGRRGRRGSDMRSALLWTTAVLLGALLVGAPLALGGVHRPTLFAILGVSAALALVTAGLATTSHADLKPVRALALPMLFLLIAAAQLIPIPAGMRGLLDPAGSELLGLARLTGAQPLSLDPPETYLEFAKAAAALAVALAALVLASGRRLRFLAVGLVACSGLIALTVGLGHRAVAEDKIYGLISTARGLPIGPFVNPNHTAEFLELAAFTSLAFSYARSTLGGQRTWKLIAALLAAGALSALSRGSLLALGSGALTWFLLAPRSEDGTPFHRTRFAALLLSLLVVVGIAIGLGAEKLVGSLAATGGDNVVKVSIWFDALKIVRAHPAGIGLGAFGRVYPVYQTLPSLSWFEYVENQPVGLLIEAGIPGLLLVLGALALTVRQFAKHARRDRIEASLAAGLVAILAHNLADFGLETAGVLLPFSAILGAMLGRQAMAPDNPAPRRIPVIVGAAACVCALAAIAVLGAPIMRNFDELLRRPTNSGTRAVAHAASLAHPTDYVYALAEAKLEPQTVQATSTRLRMLNRAMILCPLCVGAHQEAARDLWRLGRHGQALVEWKTIVALSRPSLWWVLDELSRLGATPREIETLVNDQTRYEISKFFLARGQIDAAKEALASANDRESLDFFLAQAEIAMEAKDLATARQAVQRALQVAPIDARAALIAAEVELRANDTDKAIGFLKTGLRADPTNVELNRKLLTLLMPSDHWQEIDHALDGLRGALAANGAPLSEANVNAARIFEHRGQYRRAVSEYQAALTQNPDDTGLQLALGKAAEQSGNISTASGAYTAVLRRMPDNAEARSALERIQRDKKLLEVIGANPAHTSMDDK